MPAVVYGEGNLKQCHILLYNHHYMLLYSLAEYQEYWYLDSWKLVEKSLMELANKKKTCFVIRSEEA